MYSHPSKAGFSSTQCGSSQKTPYSLPVVSPSSPPSDCRTEAISSIYKQNLPNMTTFPPTATNSQPVTDTIHSLLFLLNKNSVPNHLKILPKHMLDFLFGDEVSEINQLALKIANLRCSTSNPIYYEGIKLDCKEGDTIFNLYEHVTSKDDVDVITLKNLRNVVIPLYLYLEDAIEKNNENALLFQVCLNDTRTQFQSYPNDRLLYKQIEECKANLRKRNRNESLEEKKEIYEDFELFPITSKPTRWVIHSDRPSFYNPSHHTSLPDILAQPVQNAHSPAVNLQSEKSLINGNAEQSFRPTDNSLEIQSHRGIKPSSVVVQPLTEKPHIPGYTEQFFRPTDNSLEIQSRVIKPSAIVVQPLTEKRLINTIAQASLRSSNKSARKRSKRITAPTSVVVQPSTEKSLSPEPAMEGVQKAIKWHNTPGSTFEKEISDHCRLLDTLSFEATSLKEQISTSSQQNNHSTKNPSPQVVNSPAAKTKPTIKKSFIPANLILSNRTNAKRKLSQFMYNTFDTLKVPLHKTPHNESAQQNFHPSQKQIDLLTSQQKKLTLIDQKKFSAMYNPFRTKTSSPSFVPDHELTTFPIEEQPSQLNATNISPFSTLSSPSNRIQNLSPVIAYNLPCSPFDVRSPSFADTPLLTNKKKSKEERIWEKEKDPKSL